MQSDCLVRLQRLASEGRDRGRLLRFECITIIRDLIEEVRETLSAGSGGVRILSEASNEFGTAKPTEGLWYQCADCIVLNGDGTYSMTLQFSGTQFTTTVRPGADSHSVFFSCSNPAEPVGSHGELQVTASFTDHKVHVERLCDSEGNLIRKSAEREYHQELMQNPFEDRSYLHPVINAMASAATDFWQQFPFQEGPNVSREVVAPRGDPAQREPATAQGNEESQHNQS